MHKEYVSNTEGVYRVGHTRVSLDSLVSLYWEGASPEAMVDSFPSLTLEQVHGALAFYLGNRTKIDAYLEQDRRYAEIEHARSRSANAELIAKLQRAARP